MIFIIITFISVSLSGPTASVLKFFYFFIYYFWLHEVLVAALGLFSSCGQQGLSPGAVRRLLRAVASPVAEHGAGACRLQQLCLRGSLVVAPRL